MGEHTPAPTPSRGVHGFALYLICTCGFGIYIIWALVPDSVLHSLGVTYYPQKYWAIALPVYCMMGLALFAFLVYPSLNLLLTPALNSMETVTDVHALYKNVGRKKSFLNCGSDGENNFHGIPSASDIPITHEKGSKRIIRNNLSDSPKSTKEFEFHVLCVEEESAVLVFDDVSRITDSSQESYLLNGDIVSNKAKILRMT